MKTSFWKLLQEKSIEIPIIQRDYAQGRTQEQDIADKFIEKIKSTLDENTPLNLDFVYGKTDESKLIPLDGQQRLTTLFLLHWYFASKEKDCLTDEVKQTLSKFSYETRTSSQDFCRELSKFKLEFSEKTITEEIENQNWFSLSWKKDPTVKAMLNMLDTIHNYFKESNQSNYFEKLTEDYSLLTFSLLPLEQFKLTDELYIKMNSRGKPLTDFENFKSQFSSYLKVENQSKLDNAWYDIFWNTEIDNPNLDTKKVDEKFYYFFENICLNFYMENNDISKTELDGFDLFKYSNFIYNKDQTEYIENTIKILDGLLTFKDENNYFEKSHISVKVNSYWEKVRFYALCTFFIHKGKITNQNEIQFSRWMRVCRNLINNTLIQSTDIFAKAIRGIKELSKGIDDIYTYLQSKPVNSVFLDNQRSEEIVKAELINNSENEEWEKEIIKTEETPYFNGQIGFILEFAKSNGTYNLGIFKTYSAKLIYLFNDLRDEKDNIFQRALFSIGDYLVDISTSKTFCSFENNLRSRIDNWRKVFNESDKSLILKSLLDQISLPEIDKHLQDLIDNCTYTDWKKHFVEFPEIIQYCAGYQIRFEDNNLYLARSSARNWIKKAEFYTFLFYIKHIKNNLMLPFTRSDYFDSAYEIPCAFMDSWVVDEKYNYTIDVKFDNTYYFEFFDRKGNNISEEVTLQLKNLGFELRENGRWKKKLESDINTYDNLKSICEELNPN